MTAPKYVVRLMFEWGGGCLWCGNEAAQDAFDVGPIEARLPIAASTRTRLEQLTVWHDQSLNWAFPSDPGPWSADDFAAFEAAADELLETIRGELGPEFEVVYKRL